LQPHFRPFLATRHHHRSGQGALWAGALFWPGASWDVLNYTFDPYADDGFWPYPYPDLYEGIFGGPAVSAYAAAPAPGEHATDPPCGILAAWRVEQIAQTLHLDDVQRAALDALNDTAGAALETLRPSCSQALPGSPIARMQALQARLSAMLQETERMRPALARFYAALNDTQREQLTASAASPAQCTVTSPALLPLLPVEAMARELRVDAAQRAALHDLQHALVQAGDILQRQCAPTQPTAVLERFEQIQAQLRAALRAVRLIEPALAAFYGLLGEEQRQRFSRIAEHSG
jgi:hypothetical protein